MHNNVDVRIGSKDKNRPNVWMCLKVCTLSDIATGNGITLQQDTIEGKAEQSISSKAYGWPRNPKPTSCIRTWQRALQLTFMTGQCHVLLYAHNYIWEIGHQHHVCIITGGILVR